MDDSVLTVVSGLAIASFAGAVCGRTLKAGQFAVLATTIGVVGVLVQLLSSKPLLDGTLLAQLSAFQVVYALSAFLQFRSRANDLTPPTSILLPKHQPAEN